MSGVAQSEPLPESTLPALLGARSEPAPARAAVIPSLVRREIQRIGEGLRYPLIAALLIVLMALSAVTEGARYRSRLRGHDGIRASYEASLIRATPSKLAETQHPAIKPPWRLALAVDGGEAASPDVYQITLSPFSTPSLVRSQADDDGMPGPAPLDWMFAIRVVLALGTFLLGYDAICGDRERGTLKILLSYPVSRGQVLLAKFLALAASVALPFLVGAALSLALAAGQGLRFAGEELAKVGLVVALGLVAAVFWSLTALLVSTLHRSPAASLSVLLLLWVGIAVAIPAMGGLLAHGLVPIPGDEEVARRLDEVEDRISQRYHQGQENRWRGLQAAAANGYDWERISIRAQNERLAQQDAVRRDAFRRKLAQARAARSLASISPASLLEDLAERITSAGLRREESFLGQTAAFQRQLADVVRKADLQDPTSPHLHFAPEFLSQQIRVEESGIPRFHFQERTLAEGMAAARPLFVILALELAFLAAAAGYFFARYEAG